MLPYNGFFLGTAVRTVMRMSRAVQRQPEIAIRNSLGTGLWRVARQLVTEGLVLAPLRTAAGLKSAHQFPHLAIQVLSGHLTALPDLQRVPLDGCVLLFYGPTCLLTTLLCSLGSIVMEFRRICRALFTAGAPGTDRKLDPSVFLPDRLGGRVCQCFASCLRLHGPGSDNS